MSSLRAAVSIALLLSLRPIAPAAAFAAAAEEAPPAPTATTAAAAADDDDGRRALANTDETAHEVSFKLTAPDLGTFTVTREFAARSSEIPMRLDRQLGLPDQSVVTSFAIRSDGAWRDGRLGPRVAADKSKPKAAGQVGAAARPRPWASLEGQKFKTVRVATPAFRATDKVSIRYTLWSQGLASHGVRRWTYCGGDQNEGDKDEKVVPRVTLPPGHGDLRLAPTAGSDLCVTIEKDEPDVTAPTSRFGTYQLGPHAWWWRLELVVPEKTAAVPTPPDAAPVVFVLDASRSQELNGGLGPQLAIVESYLANTPAAEVELVMVSRAAQRVFSRFVPAQGFKKALPLAVVKKALGNGSSLDKGIEVAAAALKSAGKPGRVVLMTDGVVRSRWPREAVLQALRDAPAGSIVHVVYPGSWESNEAISHNVPDGLDELAASFGGGSYAITVSRSRRDGEFRVPSPDLLRGLVKPEGLESLRLFDSSGGKKTEKRADKNARADKSDKAGKGEGPEWPDALEGDQAGAGDVHVWSGVSDTPPPKQLSLAGWVWAKKVQLPIRPDPAFQQRLAKLVTSEDEVMGCQEQARHRKDALAQRFLAPSLVFAVPGDGPPDAAGENETPSGCGGGYGGGGSADPPSKPDEIVQYLGNVLHRCGLVAPDDGAGGGAGALKVDIETHRLEILDVTVDGGEDWERECLENGLWAVNLPPAFNEGQSQRLSYQLALTRKKKPASP